MDCNAGEGPHQELLDAYTCYMRELQGLAPATIDQRLRVARNFLTLCCPPPRTPAALTPRDVERFVARRARRLGRSTITNTVGYLPKFLCFCQEPGLCPPGLDAIDRPHRYRDEKPPRAIPWKLAQRAARLDRSFDADGLPRLHDAASDDPLWPAARGCLRS